MYILYTAFYTTASFPNEIFGHPRNSKQSLNRLKNLNGDTFVEILNMAKLNEFF